MKTWMAIGTAGVLFVSASAYAAGPRANEAVQRNVHQQQRIEHGLESGALTTREAAVLEHRESRIERVEARSLGDGAISRGEAARIDAMQDRTSAAIFRQKHDAQTGNPDSASSQRMQASVERNVHQQQRIAQGAASGELTNREVAGLQHGQARVTSMEARAGRNGYVGPVEQARVQRAENRQSRRIYGQKHD